MDALTIIILITGELIGGVVASLLTLALIAAGMRHNNRKQLEQWQSTEMNPINKG